MKEMLMVLVALVPPLGWASTNSFASAMARLDGLQTVSGDAVGEAGTPGEFYQTSQELLATGHMTNFLPMIQSTNPIVRVMGAYCVIKTKTAKVPVTVLDSLRRDRTVVPYNPRGCIIEGSTVAEIVTEFLRNPDVLEWRKKNRTK